MRLTESPSASASFPESGDEGHRLISEKIPVGKTLTADIIYRVLSLQANTFPDSS